MVENNYTYYLQQLPKTLANKIQQCEEKGKIGKWSHIFNSINYLMIHNLNLLLLFILIL